MRSFALFSALAAAFTAVSAVTPPVGDPKGNAIVKPTLNEIVPVGKAYPITWIPDTEGTVSILLLRGPSTNVVPIGAPIAEGIENSGTFMWTPGPELEPDTERYGIQLIVDATGQYQYSTQFGISNPDYEGGETTTTGSGTVTSTTAPGNTTTSATETESSYPTTTEETTTRTTEPTTTKAPTTTEKPTEKPTYEVPTTVSTTLVTSTKPGNTTVPKPTQKPSNTTTPEPPLETGAASSMVLSLGMGLISVAVAGFALL